MLSPVFRFTKAQWLILSITSLGTLIAALNTSIINIALPSITTYYGSPLSTAEWVVMIYLLLMSSLVLIFGRLGDMFGYKKIYVLGFAIFTVSSLFMAMAPNIFVLIGARAIQALGSAMVIGIVQAIIAANFPPGERGRAIGLNSMVVSLGLASGPSLGGFLISAFNWHSIFYINIPIGLVGTLWAWRVLPFQKGVRQKFDLVGAGSFFVSQMSLLLALSHGQEWGWSSPVILGLLGAALALFALFLYWENHFDAPMIHLGLFRNRLFSAANLAAFLNYMTQYSVTFLMPFYLIDILHLPANKAGLLMTVFPLVMMITSPFSGVWVDRIGSRALTSLGMGIIASAIIILSRLNSLTVNTPMIISGLGLVGLGTGLFLTPNNTAIMSSVPKGQAGIGSGMIATMRSLGQVMGIAVSGAVFTTRMAHYSAALETTQEMVFTLAQRDAYLVAFVFALCGLTASFIRGSFKASPQLGNKP